MKKRVMSLAILLIAFVFFNPNVYAGSLSISTSSSNIVKGNSVSITVKASGLTGKFSITSSDGSILSGGTSSVWLENESKTYNFTAKNLGKATISIKALDVSDSSGNPYSGSKSVTVNVVKPREKSTNNNLKNLSIEGYTLSPTFNKDTLEYTVNLESSVEKIKINASKEDSYASISGTGEKQVQEGDNKFEITVTSETGSSKVYTVNAIVKDSNPIDKVVDGKSYTVVKRSSALTKPELFESTTVSINDTEIPAFYNETTNITLIGLKDENGSIHLFKYDTKTDSLTKYESLTSSSKTIIFENTNEEVDDYTKTTVTINNIEYNAYQHQFNKDYILIYGMDIETGEKNWYLYNIKEKSIQTYMGDIIDNMNDSFNKTIKEYKTVLLGMAGLSLVLLIIIIIQFMSKNKMNKKLLKKIQSKQENNMFKKKEELKAESVDSINNETQEKIDSKKKKKKNNTIN